MILVSGEKENSSCHHVIDQNFRQSGGKVLFILAILLGAEGFSPIEILRKVRVDVLNH